jgi:hypothetical protein
LFVGAETERRLSRRKLHFEAIMLIKLVVRLDEGIYRGVLASLEHFLQGTQSQETVVPPGVRVVAPPSATPSLRGSGCSGCQMAGRRLKASVGLRAANGGLILARHDQESAGDWISWSSLISLPECEGEGKGRGVHARA